MRASCFTIPLSLALTLFLLPCAGASGIIGDPPVQQTASALQTADPVPLMESSRPGPGPADDPSAAASALLPTTIRLEAGQYRLYRNDQPYYIKGVGGDRYLELAAAAGANSVRPWGAHHAGKMLEEAQKLDMSVLVGFWLSHDAGHYEREEYRDKKFAEVREVVQRYKHHPALLMWSLGNEINLQGAGTPLAWQFVNELAEYIKSEDPDHPVITVISYDETSMDLIACHAPQLDAVGINAYRSVSRVHEMVENSLFSGPYLITEWGVDGHWEVDKTTWGSPIEPTSTQKAQDYHRRYAEHILANSDRCLGSYVFLWGQKQERTATWFSMFIENIPGYEITQVSSPAVDVMGFNWSGAWPENRAPEVTRMTINLSSAYDDIALHPGQPLMAAVTAWDPENDRLTYLWELLEKPTDLGEGGAYERRPNRVGDMTTSSQPMVILRAPQAPGFYRMFVYVFDEKGHVGTANVPFKVHPLQGIDTIADSR